MAGTSITVEAKGIKTVSDSIRKMLANAGGEPALRQVGEYLLESTQQRFVEMQAPSGEPWEELSPSTLAKKKRTDRILTESGTLADTLRYQLNDGELQVGSPMEYAATHQLGRDEIPMREFLGLAPFEHKEILEIISDHMLND